MERAGRRRHRDEHRRPVSLRTHPGRRRVLRPGGPRVRAQVPDASIRFVGRHDGGLGDLDQSAGVELAGEVECSDRAGPRPRRDRAPARRERTRRRCSRRSPAGSRRRHLSAARAGADPDRHLLIADEPAAFASACVRLLSDDGLPERVAAKPSRCSSLATAGGTSGPDQPRDHAHRLMTRVLDAIRRLQTASTTRADRANLAR